MADSAPPIELPDESASSVRDTKLVVLAIAIATVGGVVFRFVTSSPLWLDEALSVNLAELGFSDMVTALRHDGHPILYYLLLGWWIDLFGDSDIAVRALSGLFSLASVPVLWSIARRRYGVDVARHTLGLGLAAPFLLRYGSETRMYSLIVLLVAVGWLLLDRAMEDPNPGRLAPVALVTAALAHTHYWTFWLLAAVAIALAWKWRHSAGAEASASLRSLIAVIIGAATVLVWTPVLLDQLRHTGTPWAPRARPAEIFVETVQAFGGGRRFEPMLLGIVLVMLTALGATFARRDRTSISLTITGRPSTIGPVSVALGALVIGGVVSLTVGGAFEGRYAAVVLPMLIVLSARGTAALGDRVAPLTLLLLVIGGLVVGADDARRDRSQGHEVASVINGLAQPGDIVAFCPDQLSPSTIRYLDFESPLLPYPSGYDPGLVDWQDYLDQIADEDPTVFASSLDQSAGPHAVFLVFNSTYNGFDGQCETIVDSLTASGRTDEILVNGREIFQPMFLRRMAPTQ